MKPIKHGMNVHNEEVDINYSATRTECLRQCGSSEVIVGEHETAQNKRCFWKAVVYIDE